MEGTVISDAMDLASRIESLTKLYGAPILAGSDMFAWATTSCRSRSPGRVRITGRLEEIDQGGL
jgi:two-component system sensor histidine kinase ChiS